MSEKIMIVYIDDAGVASIETLDEDLTKRISNLLFDAKLSNEGDWKGYCDATMVTLIRDMLDDIVDVWQDGI
jgi:aerobic-type carbon monoxide dehydrogenase small subunit (CoxS/CutS family)